MGGIKPPLSALDPMIPHGVVDPLPQIPVPDRHQLPKLLPVPVVLAPTVQTLPQTAPDVTAAGDQRYPGRLVQRFQATYHRQQLKPLPGDSRLLIGDLEAVASPGPLQPESPSGRRVVLSVTSRR
jgi:hypothetical protein